MADAHVKHHDYHLVDPSPWPITGSFGALFLALGFIYFMHGGAAWWLVPGILVVLYTMLMWWRDVVQEGEFQGYHTKVVQISLRYGMMLFIASEVMFFVAWFWAYYNVALFPGETQEFARTALTGGHWPPKGIETFDPWEVPLLNTLILLTSGTTVTWAHHAMIHGDRTALKKGLWLTVALGICFTLCQIYEYSHAAFSYSGHIYGATFFMATGFHGAHVIIGTLFLAVCLYRVYLGHFSPNHHFGFEAAAWYWHFVDVVWLFLFASIYVWGYGGAAAGG